MPCQTNTLSPSCGFKIKRKHYPSGKMFVDECHVTRLNQGLFSTTMEAEKRDPGNEVASGKGSFRSQSPLQCTCSFSGKMVCFCSASLKILVSNRRYVIFLPRDFKIGRRQKHVWDRILREVAGALEHIRSCRFIRNDLKSNNVVSKQKGGTTKYSNYRFR